jgi:RimJ/RimL family protein N-acetyltransferase
LASRSLAPPWLRVPRGDREVATAVRDEGFGRVGLDRLLGRCQPPNLASVQVMEKIGMRSQPIARGRHGEEIRIYSLDHERWLEVSTGDAITA